MKKLIILTFGILLVLTSCNNEDTNTVMNNESSSFNTKTLRDLDGLLFTYSTHQESADKAKAAFIELTSDADYLLSTMANVTHVLSSVRIGDNKGELLEVYYIDEPRNLIIDHLVLNPSTGQLGSVGGGGYVYEPTSGEPVNGFEQLVGGCPDNMSTLGSCVNNGDNLAYNTCVGSTITSYHLSNSSSGQVGNYQTLTYNGVTLICGTITDL